MRLYVLCLLLISSLFSCALAQLPPQLNDFITPSMVTFTKPNDIVKAYSLYPGSNPTPLQAQITNPPFKSASDMFYLYDYADFFMQSVYGLTTNDHFGANTLGFMLSSLQNNANLRGKQANSVMLQHLPVIYRTSIVDPAKYDTPIADFDNLYGITNLLKMQCISIINSFNSAKSALPVNVPTADTYNAAQTAYSNVVSSLNQLLSMTESALSSISSIKTDIVSMKDVSTSYSTGVIDAATYNDLQFNHAQNIKLQTHSLYSTLYHFSKSGISQV